MTEEKAFPFLDVRVHSTLDRLVACDLCGDTECEDIIKHSTLETMGSIKLIPMYRDCRDGITVCLKCAESGSYLKIEYPWSGPMAGSTRKPAERSSQAT